MPQFNKALGQFVQTDEKHAGYIGRAQPYPTDDAAPRQSPAEAVQACIRHTCEKLAKHVKRYVTENLPWLEIPKGNFFASDNMRVRVMLDNAIALDSPDDWTIAALLVLLRATQDKKLAPIAVKIEVVCTEIARMLVEKNQAYGNSALEPVRVFSKASAVEQILVRIDDKLSRLARGSAAGEDVEKDLLGYLVLLQIARNSEGAE